MKKYLLIVFTFAMLIFVMACNTGTTSKIEKVPSVSVVDETKKDSVEVEEHALNSPTTQLVDLIRPLPGVNVSGTHPRILVTIRGGINKSISSDVSVLYVVDNIPIGHSYSYVNQIIDVVNVSSVKALRGGQAAAYGRQGDGGVIVIKTKEIQKD